MDAYATSGFARCGGGCPGDAGITPAIASSGSTQLGSPSFALTLTQGLGSARLQRPRPLWLEAAMPAG